MTILKWLHSQNCPWDVETCRQADRVHLLRWLRNSGCPWDATTCSYAALHGRLELLQWAREHGCPWDHNTCTFAALARKHDILEWAIDQGCEYRSDKWSAKTVLSMREKGVFAPGRCLANMCVHKSPECTGLCPKHLKIVVRIMLDTVPELNGDLATMIASM